jgi:hypothetical protein
MQLLIVSEPKQRKTRAKRSATAVTFRLSPSVKTAISESAEKYSRSDNQQAEFLLKVGYLYTSGINLSDMSDREIIEKFDELTAESEDSNNG